MGAGARHEMRLEEAAPQCLVEELCYSFLEWRKMGLGLGALE